MSNPIQISSSYKENHTDFSELIQNLKLDFSVGDTLVPQRHHHEFSNLESESDTTLLLMPAWSNSRDAGVKIVTVNPGNTMQGLPSIQGSYIYIDATSGSVKAIIDAKSLTTKRTAAASALASSYLSREYASSLLMIGTGALSTDLIRAHASVRPIENVYVWGRSIEKAEKVKDKLKEEKYSVTAVKNIIDVISDVDIITSATLSDTALITGNDVRPGQHIDLVGSYKPHMRESDNEVIVKGAIFLDHYEGAMKEAGDILIPMNEGVIKASDIKADLFELCAEKHKGRSSDDEITVFKSVGHALEDLVAARYYFNQVKNE